MHKTRWPAGPVNRTKTRDEIDNDKRRVIIETRYVVGKGNGSD